MMYMYYGDDARQHRRRVTKNTWQRAPERNMDIRQQVYIRLDDDVIQLGPLRSQSLFQFIQISDACFVHLLLPYSYTL